MSIAEGRYPVQAVIAACVAQDKHKVYTDEYGACEACGEHGDPATNSWTCSCGEHVYRFRGQYDVECDGCGAQYNASGQRLRDDWRGNMSNYDSDISDMEGYEMQHAGDW